MQKITVNGITYVGKLKEKDGEMVVVDAMILKGEVGRGAIQMYLKRKNIGDLETIRFSGQGTAVSVSELNDEQEMMFDICKRAMKLAMKRGEQGVVNALFDEYLGKL